MSSEAKPRRSLWQAAAFYALPVLLGFEQANRQHSSLPLWYYAYALLPALLLVLTQRWVDGAALEHPGWRAVLGLGLSWGLPVAAVMAGPELLSGRLHTLGEGLRFAVIWGIGSAGYGYILMAVRKYFVGKARQKDSAI